MIGARLTSPETLAREALHAEDDGIAGCVHPYVDLGAVLRRHAGHIDEPGLGRTQDRIGRGERVVVREHDVLGYERVVHIPLGGPIPGAVLRTEEHRNGDGEEHAHDEDHSHQLDHRKAVLGSPEAHGWVSTDPAD